MKSVTKTRKQAAKQKLAASKSTRRVLGLNSAKKVDAEWYYSLADIETVVASILSELDSDPGAGITLESSDTGIVLNVVSSEGDEYTVDVDLGTEGDEAAEDVEDVEEEETVEE